MEISSTKTPQNEQARPAVATVWWIVSPNGSENGQKPLPKNLIFHSLLDSPVNPVRDPTDGPRRPRTAEAEAGRPIHGPQPSLPSSLERDTSPPGRPSEAAGAVRLCLSGECLSVWLSVCLSGVCLSGSALGLALWLSGLAGLFLVS